MLRQGKNKPPAWPTVSSASKQSNKLAWERPVSRVRTDSDNDPDGLDYAPAPEFRETFTSALSEIAVQQVVVLVQETFDRISHFTGVVQQPELLAIQRFLGFIVHFGVAQVVRMSFQRRVHFGQKRRVRGVAWTQTFLVQN